MRQDTWSSRCSVGVILKHSCATVAVSCHFSNCCQVRSGSSCVPHSLLKQPCALLSKPPGPLYKHSMGKKRQHRPEKHKQDLGAQIDDPNAAGVRVSRWACSAAPLQRLQMVVRWKLALHSCFFTANQHLPSGTCKPTKWCVATQHAANPALVTTALWWC